MSNSLYELLPALKAYNHLRSKEHSFELPSYTPELPPVVHKKIKKSFIPRCLFKYI